MTNQKKECCEKCWDGNYMTDDVPLAYDAPMVVCKDPSCECHTEAPTAEWEERATAALRAVGVEDHIPAILKVIEHERAAALEEVEKLVEAEKEKYAHGSITDPCYLALTDLLKALQALKD